MERNFRGGSGFRPQGGGFSTVKVGDELDVKIEAVGEKGDGIAKKDGFVLFVPNTKKDDQVRIRVTKVLRKVGFAEVVGAGASSDDAGESSEVSDNQGSDSGEEDYAGEDSEDFGEEEETQ